MDESVRLFEQCSFRFDQPLQAVGPAGPRVTIAPVLQKVRLGIMRFKDDREWETTAKQPPAKIWGKAKCVEVIDVEQDRPESAQEINVFIRQPGSLSNGNLPIQFGATEGMTN